MRLIPGDLSVSPQRANPSHRGRSHPRRQGQGPLRRAQVVFAESLPDIPYSTAIRYRLLARRLRQALDIPPALPLGWLLSDASPASLTQDPTLLPLIASLRRRVADFLYPFRSQAALSRALAQQLDLAPCPFSRRSPRRTPAQRARNLADDSARLDRYIATLSAKLRVALPLSPPERRALAYLRALGIFIS
ncbi:MAG: hypothetical protein ILO10_00360 [Kiritimatiellae bacterium]|nr:hypothetical protein [Kiritimatiellia bacterium]